MKLLFYTGAIVLVATLALFFGTALLLADGFADEIMVRKLTAALVFAIVLFAIGAASGGRLATTKGTALSVCAFSASIALSISMTAATLVHRGISLEAIFPILVVFTLAYFAAAAGISRIRDYMAFTSIGLAAVYTVPVIEAGIIVTLTLIYLL